MPPKKKVSGLSRLTGKEVSLESVYDSKKLTVTLLSIDDDYLEVRAEGIEFFLNKNVIRVIKEEISE